MDQITSREKILKRVRDALLEKSEPPFPILDLDSDLYFPLEEELDITFAQQLINASGKFIYAESEDEFIGTLKSFILEKNWPLLYCSDPVLQHLLKENGIPFSSDPSGINEVRIGITRCENLIARYGSVLTSSQVSLGRKIIAIPEIHLVVGYTSQLVTDIRDALKLLRKKYVNGFPSMVSLITGPSRTADIEKTLVMGAHGPRDLYVFLIDDGGLSPLHNE
jgi:L-lactate dehydrogenase complex protein LldG